MSRESEHAVDIRVCVGLDVEFQNKILGFDWLGSPREILDEMKKLGLDPQEEAQRLETRIACRRAYKSANSFRFPGGPHAEALMKLLDAVGNGELENAKGIIEVQPAVLTDDYEGAELPLIFSAVMDDVAAVRLLLLYGADANRADNIGMTALHWAAVIEHSRVVSVLLESGARTDILNAYLLEPANLALLNGHRKLSRQLGRGVSVVEGGELLMQLMRRMRFTVDAPQ